MPMTQTINMLGLFGASSYVAARLARASGLAAFHRYAILAQPRAGLPPMPRGYRVAQLDPAELSAHAVDASPAVQALRFGARLTCLGVFDPKDKLTGLVWLGTGSYREDEVEVCFRLPPESCWDTGLWIAPQHRLGRSFAALWAGVGLWMEQHGYTHSFSRIADYNLPALNAHRRMGGVVAAHHSFMQVGAWQWSYATRPRLIRLGSPRGVAELDLGGLLPAPALSANLKQDDFLRVA